MSEDTDYANFGANAPVSVSAADPVSCALGNPVTGDPTNMFTCAGNPQRTQLGLMDYYMGQRCANKWDGYCDLYLNQQLKADYTQKAAKEFIRATLMSMFCHNDTTTPGSECYERCELLDPTASSSFSVCIPAGDVVFRSSYKREANSTDFNQSGKLNTTEPIKIAPCPKVCDLLSAEKLTDDNKALNIALDNGIAMDLVQNLVENIVAQGMQDKVTNTRLKDFMNKYIQDGSVKPGLYNLGAGPQMSSRPIAVPAVNPYLPPKDTFVVNENKGVRGVTPIIKSPPSTPYIPQAQPAQPSAPQTKPEPFGFFNLSGDSSSDKKMLLAILVVSALAVAAIIIAKRK